MRTREIEVDGDACMGTCVEIDQTWGKYTELMLADGNVLRVRYDVLRVARVDGKTGTDGGPLYVIEGVPVVSVVTGEGAR